MRVSIKSKTSYGRPASPASEKQTAFAVNIITRINAALDEVSAIGFAVYADEVGIVLDALTDGVEAGPRDVIEYLKNIERYQVFSKCYQLARRDRNSLAVNALNPYNI